MCTEDMAQTECLQELSALLAVMKPGMDLRGRITAQTTLEEIRCDSLDLIRLLSLLVERGRINEDDDFSGITSLGEICRRLKPSTQAKSEEQC